MQTAVVERVRGLQQRLYSRGSRRFRLGRWYLGNQVDWIVFGSNRRMFRAETGAWAGSSWRFRIQFHNTASRYQRNPAARGHLSDEFTFIAEHFYKHGSWLCVLLGDSIPGASLEGSGLSNPFSGLNPGALPAGNHRSFDVVLGSGIRF